MEQLVALSGQQTLLLTGVEHVEYLLACLCVQNAFKEAIMMVMTSICFGILKNHHQLLILTKSHPNLVCRSQAGGACDCGDSSVMKEAGFCDRHGPHAQQGKPILPPNLLAVAQVAMPYILTRLILHLRSHR